MPNTDKSNTAPSNPRPRTRQRVPKPPPDIAVPDIDADAAERKRVLNVLAQRRYRQRKRQSRLAADKTCGNSSEGTPSQRNGTDVELSIPDPVSRESDTVAFTNASQTFDDFQLGLDVNTEWAVNDPGTTLMVAGTALSPTFLENVDMSFTCDLLDKGSATDNSGANSTGGSSWTSLPDLELVSTSSSDFPDSYLLPMNELTLLRAMLRIATRLNAEKVWELTAVSPFNLGTGPSTEQLPTTWQPTASQLLVPHHPLVDLLPWPTCRDRMIGIMSLPEEARPPIAQDALALVNFAYDMEDSAEGIRIWGDDPYDEKSWEVGQVVFERWWFIFDRNVIERSNHWRHLRGAPLLRITSV